MIAGVDDLSEIVRRNLGRHADGDAIRAVDDEVGNSRRQHHRLDRGVIEVGDKVDRVLVDVGQQLFGNFGEARLGVPVGCWRVAIHRTKIALSIDQRIAQTPGLRQAHHRVVDSGIAVRMVLLQTLAHYAGALHVLAIVQHAHVVHGVQNAAMHRL